MVDVGNLTPWSAYILAWRYSGRWYVYLFITNCASRSAATWFPPMTASGAAACSMRGEGCSLSALRRIIGRSITSTHTLAAWRRGCVLALARRASPSFFISFAVSTMALSRSSKASLKRPSNSVGWSTTPVLPMQ